MSGVGAALTGASQKWYGLLPRFDPDAGETIAEPPGSGYGYWAGAPSAVYDRETSRFYVYYRLRWPLGDRRGGVCRIAESEDGISFRTIWEATKEQFGATSVERAALLRDPSGEWRLYISYDVAQSYDRNPATWRVDLLQAASPAEFDPATRRVVMDATMYGFSHVKDPVVVIVGGEYLALTSVGHREQHHPADDEGLIRTRGRGMVALHRSIDGIHFPTAQILLEPETPFDALNIRPSALVYLPPVWSLLYDGSPSRADAYDEFCGLAISDDLVKFRRLTPTFPWVRSGQASGSVRYVDVVPVGDTIHYFYEYARGDRAHELRHSAVGP